MITPEHLQKIEARAHYLLTTDGDGIFMRELIAELRRLQAVIDGVKVYAKEEIAAIEVATKGNRYFAEGGLFAYNNILNQFTEQEKK